MIKLLLDHCLLPQGWAQNVAIDVQDGVIATVEADAKRDGYEPVHGVAIPGLSNIHCHAFQRGLAALAERPGPAHDNFWTWREAMYHFLERLTPDDIEAISAFAYMEMLERGFTSVAEFHYLHHDPRGEAYADPAETGARIVASAAATGIGLTLLPTFYAHANFGGEAPLPGQRRFINGTDRFLELCEAAGRHLSRLPDAKLGVAIHSLRAATPGELDKIVSARPRGPIHIHAAEQQKEVDDCLAWSKQRPVEWLLCHADIDEQWCLVHATHMTPAETAGLAASGAVAGLCPDSEANLGDGVFDGVRFREASGRFGIGTDSQIEITAPGELKQLEYSQRLAHRRRNVMVGNDGRSTGRSLYDAALLGGEQASARPIGRIAPGYRADIVVLDQKRPDFAAVEKDGWLDVFIFTAGAAAIRTVLVGGDEVVSSGRHRHRSGITHRYRKVMARLARS